MDWLNKEMVEKLSGEKFWVVGTEKAHSCFTNAAVDSEVGVTTYKRDVVAVTDRPVKIPAHFWSKK